MDAYANFINGTITLFSDPMGILIFFGGVVGGMLFGAIPGVSMLTLAAILLPFTAHYPLSTALCCSLLFTVPGFMAER